MQHRNKNRCAKVYVNEGGFGNKLLDWVGSGGGSDLETTKEVRRMIGQVLITLDTTMSEITEVALQVTASCNASYRGSTNDWWKVNIDSDGHFKDVLFELLDYMVVVVETGEEAQYAWMYVKACVQEDESGVRKWTRERLDEIVKFIVEIERNKSASDKKPQRASCGSG
jgi:hypothetical protein